MINIKERKIIIDADSIQSIFCRIFLIFTWLIAYCKYNENIEIKTESIKNIHFLDYSMFTII